MLFRVAEKITIEDCDESLKRRLSTNLTFDNPEYIKKLRMGKWVGGTPPTISLMERNGANIIVPFGLLKELWSEYRDKAVWRHSLQNGAQSFDFKSGINLYPYQQKAVTAALRAKQGIIVAPCGSGKTMIGLQLAAMIGGKTLWLTHTTDLLYQSMERAKAYFDLKPEDYGTITGGKIDIGNVITFATVQTMANIDPKAVRDTFCTVIVDECHHVCGGPTKLMMFYKVISSLAARYKYGLTATPKRSDGLTACMYALLGPKAYEIDAESVEDYTCKVKAEIRHTLTVPDMRQATNPDGTLNYVKLINGIVEDEERNNRIVEDIAQADGSCLVLTERVAHAKRLSDMLWDRGIKNATVFASTRKAQKEERKKVLSKLNNDEIKVVIATYALAKEGLDVPRLRNLFMATPQKNDTVVTQSAGRVARKADGKTFGKLIDYCDPCYLLESWQRKRATIYKRLGFEIE